MTQPSLSVVVSAWKNQAIWSEVANHAKANLSKWRYRAAVASVLGAFLETLAASLGRLGPNWWSVRALIALAGAVTLSVVPYILQTKVSKDRVREWVRARSASEALKELIYRYLMAAEPFGPAPKPGDLNKQCEAVMEKVQDLNIHAAAIHAPLKDRPSTLTAKEYLNIRVNDQIENFYKPKGRNKALKARRLHNVEFSLGLLAVIMGALASAAEATGLDYLSVLGSWVAVVTTASAAVTAHLAASRYDHEAIIYFGTANRLTGLKNEWSTASNPDDPTAIAKFVDACEDAISTENESWLAGWTRDSPTGTD